ncbi:MAG TPA: histidine phosphatase family protein [Terriglobia bacterium]|nr:histidine phosphatase family protein [Terriglobia bacterium]
MIRHGLSTSNVRKRCQGSSDASLLTEEGRQAARLTGEALRDVKFAAVFTSPLRRALETAQNLSLAWPHPSPGISVDSRLKEISLQDWEGLSFESIADHFPWQYGIWKSAPHLFCQRSAAGAVRFPVTELFECARSFLSEVATALAGKRALVVTHGGTGRALILSALGVGPEWFNSIQQSNLGLTVIGLPNAVSRQASLEVLNATPHLGSAPPKLKAGRSGLRLVLQAVEEGDGSEPARLHRISRGCRLDPGNMTGGPELLVSGSESVLAWILRAIDDREDTSLETLLAQAAPALLTPILSRVFRVDQRFLAGLRLRAGTFTVLHYPGSSGAPILQTANVWLSDSGADRRGPASACVPKGSELC